MAKNAPARQHYPNDFVNPDVLKMDLAERGLYYWLIDMLWINGGKLPANDEDVFRIASSTSRKLFNRCWGKIRYKFDFADGYFTHKRVSKDMQTLEKYRDKKSKAGKRGADKRWHNYAFANGCAIGLPLANDSSSSSSSSSNNIYILAEAIKNRFKKCPMNIDRFRSEWASKWAKNHSVEDIIACLKKVNADMTAPWEIEKALYLHLENLAVERRNAERMAEDAAYKKRFALESAEEIGAARKQAMAHIQEEAK